jgi:ribulose-5-phosphate 4-epimerase/fuculose-1-phosphate aldolase
VEDGLLMTPTNSCLGSLDPARISKLDREGRHVSGDKPSKEVFLHRAFYETCPGTGAVIHLHSTYATAVSCLSDVDEENCIQPLTPYVVMRIGKVALLPYVRPGNPAAGDLIRNLEGRYSAVLLANHGPVVSGKDLPSAVAAAEELDETARLSILLRGLPARTLTEEQISELNSIFGRI